MTPQCDRQLSIASTSVSETSVHANGNRRTFVRSVDSVIRKYKSAANGNNGALNSSITTASSPSTGEMTSQWSCASNVCRVLKSSHAPSARKSVSPVTMRARLRATSGSLSRQINSAPINGVMIVNSSQGK